MRLWRDAEGNYLPTRRSPYVLTLGILASLTVSLLSVTQIFRGHVLSGLVGLTGAVVVFATYLYFAVATIREHRSVG